MRNRRLARRLLCLILLFCLIPGCQVFQGEQSLTVLVRDAETKQPIPTAEVYVCQRLKGDEIAPCRSRELTQTNGIARLRGESAGDYGLQVQAVAPGHLPENVTVPPKASKGQPQPADAGRSSELIVEVYAAPDFSVELVLPLGYRGLVKAEIQIQDNLPLSRGQRCFRFPVSASGEVQVRGPSLLQRVPVPEYQARYANGPLLGKSMDVEKVGFRWIKSAGNCHYFVVGNQLDYEALHRRLAPEETQSPSGSWDEAPQGGGSHKFKYGKLTGKG
jgi:hypothetical protein